MLRQIPKVKHLTQWFSNALLQFNKSSYDICILDVMLPNVDGFTIGAYLFDFKLRALEYAGSKQKLSPKEAELLKILCNNRNELLPHETALRKIWGDDGYFTTRSMEVYLTKLRKLFTEDPSVEIRNIHGSGFMLEVKD